jgi:hypothetical protein
MKFLMVLMIYLAICVVGCKKERDLDIKDLERMANEDAVNLFLENKLDYHHDSH